MASFLNKSYIRQLHQPNFISLFINPFYIIRKNLVKSISRYTPEIGGTMIDFGCGLKPYKDLFTKVENYVGLDIENEGHSHENEIVDVYYNGKKIPFSDEYFDSLFCSEVLEHVFNIDEVLPEINRVLKKNAKILVTTPFAWDEHEVPNDFGRYTSFGLKYILEKHGFEVIKFEKSGHFFAVIVQFFTLFLRNLLFTRNKYLNMIINFIFISPFTISGYLFSCLVPKKKSLYFNNVVLAVKIK